MIRLAPGRLPAPISSFVGRDRELEELSALIAHHRLVTLTGPGGSGKTRLALEVGTGLPADADLEIAFVDLSTVTDEGLVMPTIGRALGLGPTEIDAFDALVHRIGDQHVTLVLDNLEQLPDVGQTLGALLSSCSNLRILATSRVSLHVRGEREFPVDPFPTPSQSDQESLARLAVNPAVELFVERARAIDPRFDLTDDNGAAIAAICRRLDGLPLALELAAARVRLLSPTALLARLDQRLPMLTGGPMDAPTRQRTLRDTIAWSVDLLEGEERRAFGELAVFVGGFVGEAAAGVLAPTGQTEADVMASLEDLVDRSLLRAELQDDGTPRFGMLETVREFAIEQLGEARLAELQGRHLAWYVAFVQRMRSASRGADQGTAIRSLLAEQANIRAALVRARETDPEALVRLMASLPRRFWSGGMGMHEGFEWFEAAHPFIGLVPPPTRIRALQNGAWMENILGDVEDEAALFDEILAVAEESDDDRGRFEGWLGLAYLALDSDELRHGRDRVERAMAAANTTGEAGNIAEVLVARSLLERREGKGDQAQASLGEALALARGAHDLWAVSEVLIFLGDAQRAAGEAGLAVATFQEGMEQAVAAGDAELVAWGRVGMGRSLTMLGRIAEARDLLVAGAVGTRQLKHPLDELIVIDGGAEWLAAVGAHADSVEAAGAADFARRRRHLEAPDDALARHELLARARRQLGPVRYDAAWTTGQERSLDEAVTAMIDAIQSTTGTPEAAGGSSVLRQLSLTEREQQILAMVAAGMSDGEIADDLVISKKTVSVHVANVKAKLGARNRVEIATRAADLGVTPATVEEA